ncbi:MAG: enoyl-CoA hydratase/isomerase family protein [Parvibaculum sp.]|nr:enoyl-CoA hydratase/isomerase family protein [Parvibaculum sp.]
MSEMTEPHVLTTIRDSIGFIELNRPAKFNCLSSTLIAAIESALDACEGDGSVRAVLIRARGKHFCIGADLDEVLDVRNDKERLARFLAGGHRMMRRLEASRLPVVAQVQGLCLAGGLELAMACDVVIASASAQLGCQHARYGLMPGFGGTQRLARLAGQRRALDLMFSARWLKAGEAQSWGLVNHVVDDGALADAAEAYCTQLAAKNLEGIAAMKRTCREGLDRPFEEALQMEQEVAIAALMSANVTEGLAAFRENREPSFR